MATVGGAAAVPLKTLTRKLTAAVSVLVQAVKTFSCWPSLRAERVGAAVTLGVAAADTAWGPSDAAQSPVAPKATQLSVRPLQAGRGRQCQETLDGKPPADVGTVGVVLLNA